MKTRKYLTQLFTSVTFCLVLTAAFGQIQKPKPNSFVIKGSIKNFNGPSWDFASTGFFGNSMNTIPVSGDGAFNKTFAIADHQDLYLYLNNDAITIFAVPGYLNYKMGQRRF